MLSAASGDRFPWFPGTEGSDLDGAAIGVLLATGGVPPDARKMLRCYFMGFVARSDEPGLRPDRHLDRALAVKEESPSGGIFGSCWTDSSSLGRVEAGPRRRGLVDLGEVEGSGHRLPGLATSPPMDSGPGRRSRPVGT